MKEKINRVPRPLGLTTASINHQAQNTEISKSSIINIIVHNYITTGFCFMGSPCSIETLSQLTNISTIDIMKAINKSTLGLSNLTNQDNLEQTVRALQSIAINRSLQASGKMSEQALILRASQGHEYKAFISSTYNMALKNELDAAKQIMEMAKGLMPQTGTQINIQNNQNQGTEKALTPAQAVLLIEQTHGRINPMEDEDMKAKLFLEHNIGDMPEVDARKQTSKGGKEGLGFKSITDIPTAEPITHENRREEEYGIDLDADQI